MSAKEIARAVKGMLKAGDGNRVVAGVSIDSRRIAHGELFIAIKGPNFDGHGFLGDVIKAGAAGAIVRAGACDDKQLNLPDGFFIIETADTVEALGDLAAFVRAAHPVPLVAVTGSAGKTTTKEMIASILGLSRKVLKTEGNFNNLIGLPLTLLRFDETHRAAVVELGISLPNEMELLVDICMPDVALITNIGSSHLESLGSVDGVARAKGALFLNPPSTCVRVVNMDDERVVGLASGVENKITFGRSEGADVRLLRSAVRADLKKLDAVYSVSGVEFEVTYPGPGVSSAMNGAAAAAVALSLGIGIEEIKAGLEKAPEIKGRMAVIRAPGLTILDDTYNANPDSVRAALATLSAAKGRKVAILGDMLELGEGSAALHADIGQAARLSGVSIVAAIGRYAQDVAQGAKGEGVDVRVFKDKRAAIELLPELLRQGDTVLVKASRGAGLEEVTEALRVSAAALT